jgi:hypothetical protein
MIINALGSAAGRPSRIREQQDDVLTVARNERYLTQCKPERISGARDPRRRDGRALSCAIAEVDVQAGRKGTSFQATRTLSMEIEPPSNPATGKAVGSPPCC